ncbi:MAG: hypothetical protein Q9191_007463 [Dirinaria sp. TL-2023a]
MLFTPEYVEGGGGFSHYPAGLSNGGAYRNLPTTTWDLLQADVLTSEFEKGFADAVEKDKKAREHRAQMVAMQEFVDALASVYDEMALVQAQLEARATGD